MEKRASGEIRVHERKDGQVTYSLRFRVNGRREVLTLGTDTDAWTHRKAERKLDQEAHHRPPAGPAGETEADRPREQERGFEVEHDEQDRDQIEAHVEFGAGVVERREAAFIFGKLGRGGPVRAGEPSDDHRQHDKARGQAEGDDHEQEDRQVAGGDACQGGYSGA